MIGDLKNMEKNMNNLKEIHKEKNNTDIDIKKENTVNSEKKITNKKQSNSSLEEKVTSNKNQNIFKVDENFEGKTHNELNYNFKFGKEINSDNNIKKEIVNVIEETLKKRQNLTGLEGALSINKKHSNVGMERTLLNKKQINVGLEGTLSINKKHSNVGLEEIMEINKKKSNVGLEDKEQNTIYRKKSLANEIEDNSKHRKKSVIELEQDKKKNSEKNVYDDNLEIKKNKSYIQVSSIEKSLNEIECVIKYKTESSIFGIKWKKMNLSYKKDEYLRLYGDNKTLKFDLDFSKLIITDGEYISDKKKSFIIFEGVTTHLILAEEEYENLKNIFSYINKKKNIDDVISSISCIMEPYIFTDFDGNIIMVNDLFCELTGYANNELMGTNIKNIFKGMNNKSLYNLKESLKTSDDILIKKKYGDFFLSSVSIGEIERGNFIYFIIIVKILNKHNKDVDVITIEDLVRFGKITQLSRNKELLEGLNVQTNEIFDWMQSKFINNDAIIKLLQKNNKELEDTIKEKDIEINKIKTELDILKGTHVEYKIFSLIKDKINYYFFIEFCKDRYVEELPMFIKNVDKFFEKYDSKILNKQEIYDIAEKIYKTFIESGSEYELNIKDRLRDYIKIKISDNDIDRNLFNNVVSECILLLKDIYDEFDKTYIAKEIKNNIKNNQ